MSNKIEIIQGDITKIEVDAMVNAANSSLLGGGGVDGAIHRAGGPEILEECRKIVAKQGGCKTGDAVITKAGKLSAKFVIHTVGPIWRGGNNDERALLANCYTNSLRLALNKECKAIAFPSISTGVYGFPKKEAAFIAIKTVQAFLANHSEIDNVIFVCFDPENFHFIENELKVICIRF
jgi:O-acetyl-ADP-ribose deacetylase (regulator of RNase III)